MKRIGKNKGFTLVELIVVIAIIGILSAVLIPSITGYIQKANFSNDQQDAGNMTKLVQAYCAENKIDVSSLSPNEVKTIILSNGKYALKTRNAKWTFVWNKSSDKVEAMYYDNATELSTITDEKLNKGNGSINLDTSGSLMYPEEVLKTGYYLIGKANTKIEIVVDAIRNYNGDTDFTDLVNILNGTKFEAYKNILLSNFDPLKTLFINESGVYTASNITGTTGGKKVEKVLFGDSISYIPSFGDKIELPSTISVPVTIEFISEGAFINVTSGTKLTFAGTPVFESGFMYNTTMLSANGGVQPISSIDIYEQKGIKPITLTIGTKDIPSGSFVDLNQEEIDQINHRVGLSIDRFKSENQISSITSAEFRVGYTDDYKVYEGKIYFCKFVVKLYVNNKLIGYSSIYYREADVQL